jgi:DNA-binding transcriptional LysR family regulator
MTSKHKLSALDAQLFVAVADLGGISAAARQLGLQKSLVSRNLAALEARLGVRLVQRTTRKVSLTDAGQMLAGYARRVVEELDNAQAALESLSEAPRGELRVTAPYSFVRFVLTPYLATFEARHPGVRLSIDPTMRVLDLVQDGIDLAIRIGELPPSNQVARLLEVIPQVLVASPVYAQTQGLPAQPRELSRHSLIELGPDARVGQWKLYGPNEAPIEVPVAPRIAVADPALVLDLALQGAGIGVVPLRYAAPSLASGALLRVLPLHHRGKRPVHAVYPSRRLLTPKVRAFIDFTLECLAAA